MEPQHLTGVVKRSCPRSHGTGRVFSTLSTLSVCHDTHNIRDCWISLIERGRSQSDDQESPTDPSCVKTIRSQYPRRSLWRSSHPLSSFFFSHLLGACCWSKDISALVLFWKKQNKEPLSLCSGRIIFINAPTPGTASQNTCLIAARGQRPQPRLLGLVLHVSDIIHGGGARRDKWAPAILNWAAPSSSQRDGEGGSAEMIEYGTHLKLINPLALLAWRRGWGVPLTKDVWSCGAGRTGKKNKVY